MDSTDTPEDKKELVSPENPKDILTKTDNGFENQFGVKFSRGYFDAYPNWEGHSV